VRIYDVSVPLLPGMVVYDGDPPTLLERVASLAGGDVVNLTRVSFSAHAGTHVDAPLHLFDGASATEALPLDVLVGPAHVVDATSVAGDIDAAALASLALPDDAERVLFKTTNSELWSRSEFVQDFVEVAPDAAAALAARVRLVGVDYLSVGSPETHRALLGTGVVVLEGLDLREIAPGPYHLVSLPLKLVGSDGAPARTVLVRAAPPS
jgi:arylformamidase